MRWPRGKHNGQKIAGFTVKFELNVLAWRTWHVEWFFGRGAALLGPVRFWVEAAYSQAWPDKEVAP